MPACLQNTCHQKCGIFPFLGFLKIVSNIFSTGLQGKNLNSLIQQKIAFEHLIAAFEPLTVLHSPLCNSTLFEFSVDARAKPWFLYSLTLIHCPRVSFLESKQLFFTLKLSNQILYSVTLNLTPPGKFRHLFPFSCIY